ncbi:MAG: hypothetical protein NT019_02230 [Candidatus Adlerbacteria bacterium]|nr:hypothetical protein [Candidatus Adlerbacteria bacterium]
MEKTTKLKKKNVEHVAPQNIPAQIPVPSTGVRNNAQMRGPSKTFQQDGHWIEKPNKTTILICECSNKYLKTRAGQDKCLRCLSAFKR